MLYIARNGNSLPNALRTPPPPTAAVKLAMLPMLTLETRWSTLCAVQPITPPKQAAPRISYQVEGLLMSVFFWFCCPTEFSRKRRDHPQQNQRKRKSHERSSLGCGGSSRQRAFGGDASRHHRGETRPCLPLIQGGPQIGFQTEICWPPRIGGKSKPLEADEQNR